MAEQLCEGGADLIQLRAKDKLPQEILGWATPLATQLAFRKVHLVINDYPAIAASIRAPFCHLGQEDFFDQGHRHVSELGLNHVQIGLSTHAPEQAERAIAAGAAYIAVGPVFPTPTKPSAKAVGLDYVRWAAANVKIPWFAIGGINLDNVSEVLAAGATRICVVSAILQSQDPSQTTRAFKKLLGNGSR